MLCFFFFNDTATTEIYTLSLHDALPILARGRALVMSKLEKPQAIARLDEIMEVSDALMVARGDLGVEMPLEQVPGLQKRIDRKSTRLNSSHANISYAVFCLKKKTNTMTR